MSTPSLLRVVWLGLLLILYAAFWLWYGGATSPVTVEEANAYLQRAAENRQHTASEGVPPETLNRLLEWAAKDDGREFYMVNIETHKKGPEAEEAAAAYGSRVVPLLLARGSFPIFVGPHASAFLGDLPTEPDMVAVVRYRSFRDLLDMNADPAMAEALPYKWASLESTIVFPMQPFVTVIQMRIYIALMLLALAWGGLAVLGRFSR